MKAETQVGIVLANWNGARFLDDAVRSVVRQTFTDWRLVCVDGHSTDESRSILEKWHSLDGRVRPVFRTERLSCATGLNIGLEHVESEYVGRIDSDDVWHPSKLEYQIDFLKRNGNESVGVCGTDVMLINELGFATHVKCFPRTQKEFLRAIWFRNPFCHSSIVMRRTVLERCGGYDEKKILVEDLDLWFRAARHWRLSNLPEPLVGYRTWRGGVTQAKLRRMIWQSYILRIRKVQEYGYRVPVMGRIYGLASLSGIIMPPGFVVGLFHGWLKLFGQCRRVQEARDAPAIPWVQATVANSI